MAESFEPYRSLRERRYPYYRIYVKNFVVYYVVIDDEGEDKIMEVRRFATYFNVLHKFDGKAVFIHIPSLKGMNETLMNKLADIF